MDRIDSKRESLLNLINIMRYVMLGLIALTFIAWLLPYFQYDKADYGLGSKDYVNSKSLWGIMLYPTNFLQIEKVLGVKFISLKELHVVVVMAIVGIIAIIVCANKRGRGTCFLPLVFSVYGIIGYFGNYFMRDYCTNPVARYIQIALIVLTLIATLCSIVLGIKEMKSRPADYYLSAVGQ